MSRSSFSLFSVQRKQKKNASDFCFNFCSRHLSLSFVHSFISFFPFSLSLEFISRPEREKMAEEQKEREREEGLSPFLLPPLLPPSTPLSSFPRFDKKREKKKRRKERRKLKNRTTEKNFDHPRRMVSLCLQTQGGGKKTETHLCLFWKHGETDRGEGEGEDEKRYHHFSSTIFPSSSMTLSFRNVLPSLRT